MSFEDEQQQKESGERIQREMDKRINALGRKPTALELAGIVNDVMAKLSERDGLIYEYDEKQAL